MIRIFSLLMAAFVALLALQPAQAVTVTSVTLTGPSRLCVKCPPGGSATYSVTVTGTDLAGNDLKWSVYDDDPWYDPTGDDVLINETTMFAFDADVNGNNWSQTFTFELFCNEETDCEVTGHSVASGDYGSGEGVAEVFVLVESMAGFDLGQSAVLSVACVPEPQSWALMIVGFGAVGASVRRRRAVFA